MGFVGTSSISGVIHLSAKKPVVTLAVVVLLGTYFLIPSSKVKPHAQSWNLTIGSYKNLYRTPVSAQRKVIMKREGTHHMVKR